MATEINTAQVVIGTHAYIVIKAGACGAKVEEVVMKQECIKRNRGEMPRFTFCYYLGATTALTLRSCY